jgi:hypothetical protein
MKGTAQFITLVLLSATLLSGCSMLTAQGRRERAYAKYVRKCSNGRVKQQSRMSSWRDKIPHLTPSEPVVRMDVAGPEAVTTGDSGM